MSADDVAAWAARCRRWRSSGRCTSSGIGGAGMSGIARILLARGVQVSGSDRRDTPTLLALRALGARVEVGHDPAHLGDADTVVVSTAIRADNPELSTARERGLRVLPRAVALAAVMAGRRSVAVAGTHGKTSTTSMLTVAVQACGVDPSFAIGGDLNESGSNAHAGEGDVFVAEADESDRSFLLLAPSARSSPTSRPTTSTTTATWRPSRPPSTGSSARSTSGLRRRLRRRPRRRPGSRRAARRPAAHLRPRPPDADLRLTDLEVAPDSTSYTATLDGRDLGRVRIQVPGEHMALNSAAALLAGLELGLPARADRGAGPVRRRAPPVRAQGRRAAGPRLRRLRPPPDRGHRPAEGGPRGGRRAAGSWSPSSRTSTAGPRSSPTVSGPPSGLADEVVVMDIYGAREDPVPGVTGALVADAVPLPPGRCCSSPPGRRPRPRSRRAPGPATWS